MAPRAPGTPGGSRRSDSANSGLAPWQRGPGTRKRSAAAISRVWPVRGLESAAGPAAGPHATCALPRAGTETGRSQGCREEPGTAPGNSANRVGGQSRVEGQTTEAGSQETRNRGTDRGWPALGGTDRLTQPRTGGSSRTARDGEASKRRGRGRGRKREERKEGGGRERERGGEREKRALSTPDALLCPSKAAEGTAWERERDAGTEDCKRDPVLLVGPRDEEGQTDRLTHGLTARVAAPKAERRKATIPR